MKRILLVAYVLIAPFWLNAGENTEEAGGVANSGLNAFLLNLRENTKEVVKIVPQKVSQTGIVSSPDQTGAVIEVFYRPDMGSRVAAIRKNGNILYLFQYCVGGVCPLKIPATDQVFWLNEKVFACVSAGRRFSFYAIYKISDSSPSIISQAVEAYPKAHGTIHCKVEWTVRENKLEGTNRYGKLIISLSSD